MINLQIYPQTALLLLVDALRSTGRTYKLELYLDPGRLGGVLWEFATDDLTQQPKALFAENDLQQLMSKFMAFLQTQGDGISEPAEATDEAVITAEEHPADATGSV